MRSNALAAVLVFTLGATILAQQPEFKAGVDLVRIPISVMRSGEPVTDGLMAADFTLKEDGVTQRIALFEREARPLSLCILLDVSGSMSEGPAALAAAAIRQVTGELQDQDEVAILAFSQSTHVLLPWSAPAAASSRQLTTEVSGPTALHDAMSSALGMLDSARHSRAVVLLITDGIDTTSRTRLTDIVKTRRQSEALVYAFEVGRDQAPLRVAEFDTPGSPVAAGIGGSPAVPFRPPSAPMISSSVHELVGDSGGASYIVTNTGSATQAARRFINDLRYQYTLGYTPAKAMDGKYRRVKVDVNKRGYQIRHRSGYLAIPSSTP